ncbi:hypothetical protein Goari_022871, partial [Gossypium aridum]|nr:hypothetical protein [Gossypium aridum]
VGHEYFLRVPKLLPRCSAEKETLIHALKDCLTARTILSIGGLDNRLLTKAYHCCIDWLDDIMRERAKTLSYDFRIYNLVNDPIILATTVCIKWEKPPRGYAKVNFDAAINNNKTRYGFIIRDEDGFVIGGGGGFKEETLSAEWAKLYAFEENLKKAQSLNISKVVFETDNASFVNRVKKHGRDVTIMGARINETQKIMDNFHSATICWANRSCNRVADFICKNAIAKSCNWAVNMDYPLEIHD